LLYYALACIGANLCYVSCPFRLIQRVLKQFILGVGRSGGGGAFGMSAKKPTAATADPIDGDSGETQPLVPSGGNKGFWMHHDLVI